jgi:hypothetical protein
MLYNSIDQTPPNRPRPTQLITNMFPKESSGTKDSESQASVGGSSARTTFFQTTVGNGRQKGLHRKGSAALRRDDNSLQIPQHVGSSSNSTRADYTLLRRNKTTRRHETNSNYDTVLSLANCRRCCASRPDHAQQHEGVAVVSRCRPRVGM